MSRTPIADHALLSDRHSSALVTRGRLGRLAVVPPLRQPVGVRPAARRPGRPLAGPADRCMVEHPPVPRRHPGARDDVHREGRHPGADRRDGVRPRQRRPPHRRRRPAPPGPPAGVHRRRGRGGHRLPPPPRVRPRRTAAHRRRRRRHRPRRRRVAGADHTRALDLRPRHGLRHRPAGAGAVAAPGAPPLDAVPGAGAGLVAAGAGRPAGRDGRGVAHVVGAAPGLRRAVGAPGAPQRAGAAGPVLPAERGDRRGRHHLVARGRRWRAQLGLPLLLGARLQLHHGGPVGRGLPGRGGGLLRVHGHRRGVLGRPGPGPADHVRRGRRARPQRARAGAPGGVARQPPRPGGQRGVGPEPGRRVRRAARRRAAADRPAGRDRRRHPAVPGGVRRRRGHELDAEGPGHLGGAR